MMCGRRDKDEHTLMQRSVQSYWPELYFQYCDEPRHFQVMPWSATQAVLYLALQYLANMKSGLGDKIESFTKATGIKKVVDTMSRGLNIPCGCDQRKETLNKMFPSKNQ
jgi:hypothetical protein